MQLQLASSQFHVHPADPYPQYSSYRRKFLAWRKSVICQEEVYFLLREGKQQRRTIAAAYSYSVSAINKARCMRFDYFAELYLVTWRRR